VSRCVVCGDKVVAKQRCHCCYEFRRPTGSDRSKDHVTRLTERDIEQELRSRKR